MTLQSLPDYPSTRSYVLKLHRDAGFGVAHLAGQLENLASGQRLAFASGRELLAVLLGELASGRAADTNSGAGEAQS